MQKPQIIRNVWDRGEVPRGLDAVNKPTEPVVPQMSGSPVWTHFELFLPKVSNWVSAQGVVSHRSMRKCYAQSTFYVLREVSGAKFAPLCQKVILLLEFDHMDMSLPAGSRLVAALVAAVPASG
jgi:hypothetical protein